MERVVEPVGYRHGDEGAELERMDYLELIARVTSHIPDKGQVTVRYYGLYANAHRGKVRKAGRPGFPVRIDFVILTSARGRNILLAEMGKVDRKSVTRDFSASAKRNFL